MPPGAVDGGAVGFAAPVGMERLDVRQGKAGAAIGLGTPRISHCADIGQRPALGAVTAASVQMSAPPVSRRRLPS